MNHPIFRALLLVLLPVILTTLSSTATDEAQPLQTDLSLQTMHSNRDRAGIYLHGGSKDEKYRSHPLLDAVIIGASWMEVEPKQGVYSFDTLLNEVNWWGNGGKGKGVAITLMLYGQVPGKNTPPWVYKQPDIRAISFDGGGGAHGKPIQIPAVWEKGFTDKYLEPMIAAYAKVFDGHPAVWYIMPGFGHIGNMNCQPSANGGPACLKAGWTCEQWEAYCQRVATIYQKYFKKTPLLLKAAGQFLKDKNRDNYKQEAADTLTQMGKQGIATIKFGLSADPGAMMEVYKSISGVIPFAQKGTTRIGLGDDWPLWLPESQRDGERSGSKGFDDNNLGKLLDNAFGGINGIPKIPVTVLFCQKPEIQASNPKSSDYNPTLAAFLKKARDRLKANEMEITGAMRPENLNQ